MFQSFTGSSRRPRQVNLSGRNPNPFANTGLGAGTHNALASAQQERAQRQRERDRLQAVKNIQKSWRGHHSRVQTRQELRNRWDSEERTAGENVTPYDSEETSYKQLSRLSYIIPGQGRIRSQDSQDVERLRRYCERQKISLEAGTVQYSSMYHWDLIYLKLQRILLRFLKWVLSEGMSDSEFLLPALQFAVSQAPGETSMIADPYFETMALLAQHCLKDGKGSSIQETSALDTITAPLRTFTPRTDVCYVSFACKLLTIPELSEPDDGNPSNRTNRFRYQLADRVNCKVLARSLSNFIAEKSIFGERSEFSQSEARIRLLGCFIYFHRHAHGFQTTPGSPAQGDYVAVVSSLLPSLGNVNFEPMEPEDLENVDPTAPVVNGFLKEQIFSLINSESVGDLLTGAISSERNTQSPNGTTSKAGQLANYALTLLRCFPKRADEIRMWLFIGSSSKRSDQSIPVIKYFWAASKETAVVKIISNNPKDAIKLLKARPSSTQYGWHAPTNGTDLPSGIADDWRLILIFMELYTFLLKVMDDSEFFASRANSSASSGSPNWTRVNALPLDEVKDLTTFLKNLGFTMYFHAADLLEDSTDTAEEASSLSNYFHGTASRRISTESSRPRMTLQQSIGGVDGVSMEYARGLVTGLLRGIYERDSRRNFLPKDHWLMTSRFDMDGFIAAVVDEEENRYRIQEQDDEDVDSAEEVEDQTPGLVGMARTRQARAVEHRARQQRKLSRKRFLQAVTPRSAILQNLPFFIPFRTRVEIFRRFVQRDQESRRLGFHDVETWRMAIQTQPNGPDVIAKHHAKIRRGHEFDDALDQFYSLREGLKEPIQITFVDQWDQVEAGIDGGGVTKEFLTSVTNQAFKPSDDGLNMFIENDQNLLLPNPTAAEEYKELLQQAGYGVRSQEYRDKMAAFHRRYEFIGRIVGKCLYEGILVDISFAPFFLLKWALTGGFGAAPKESQYRASLNDLKDLDEDLYRGLLQLKNYPGDVEDLSLTFTVTDKIVTDHRTGATKTVTRDLKTGGSNIPVTNQNRLVYISYVARHRLQDQPRRQTDNFLRGLRAIIQTSWLSMFNQSELQTLVGGSSNSIDIADLRRNTQYGGLYVIGDDRQEHPSIQRFWAVMESLTEEEKRAVLKFVTSTPRAPLLGFSSLNPKFSIRDSGRDQERLPSTSTCVNLLKLPVYSNPAILKEKLLYAVNSGAGFDLS